MARYCLQSSPMIHTPGVIAWAINGYAFKRDQPQMLRIVRDTWSIPEEAAKALLSKAVPYEIDGNNGVVFEYGEAAS
jgi:hypothetical protein